MSETVKALPFRRREIDMSKFEDELQGISSQRANTEVTEKDVGRLSAEAVLAQYEAASKAVEGMGDEIKERIKKLEAALVEADKDMKLVAEAAAAIREKGQLVKVQIEEASKLSEDIRSACADFRKKVGS